MQRKSKEKLQRRHRRVRAKIAGTEARPRLVVSRSHKHIRAQVIDDERGITLVASSDETSKTKGTKGERAAHVGEDIAKKAAAKGISKVVFDRGGYKYHGRVRALAEGARKGGLQF